eukprot:472732-Rhodomonas_salina.2
MSAAANNLGTSPTCSKYVGSHRKCLEAVFLHGSTTLELDLPGRCYAVEPASSPAPKQNLMAWPCPSPADTGLPSYLHCILQGATGNAPGLADADAAELSLARAQSTDEPLRTSQCGHVISTRKPVMCTGVCILLSCARVR